MLTQSHTRQPFLGHRRKIHTLRPLVTVGQEKGISPLIQESGPSSSLVIDTVVKSMAKTGRQNRKQKCDLIFQLVVALFFSLVAAAIGVLIHSIPICLFAFGYALGHVVSFTMNRNAMACHG